MADNAVLVSLVMPCLNEAKTVGVCIDKARRALAGLGVTHEIIVADNGSTDGSQDIARDAGARVVDCPVRGYGAAVRCGLDQAHGEWLLMADADDSYDLTNLAPFVDALRAGADFVLGDRFRGGIQPGAMPWLHRYIGNPLLTGVLNLLFWSRIGDAHCGLRGMTRDAYQKMSLRSTGMELASEQVIRALRLRLRVAQIPTRLFPDGRGRSPHLRSFRDGWRHLRLMLRMRASTS